MMKSGVFHKRRLPPETKRKERGRRQLSRVLNRSLVAATYGLHNLDRDRHLFRRRVVWHLWGRDRCD